SVLEKALGETAAQFPARRGEAGFISGLASAELDRLILARLAQAGVAPSAVTLAGFSEAHEAGLTIISQENWQAFHAIVDAPELAADVALRIRAGADISPAQRQAAEQVRAAFTRAVDAQLARTPFILLPTLPALPPTLQEAADPLRVVNLT
ncbi:amidase, partial [Corallococcus coralloides]|nr:amidase [Corallococcus coralloides]